MRNNQGVSTLGGWMQGAVVAVLFVVIFSVVIIGGMNTLHSKNETVAGLPTSSLQSSFEDFQNTSTQRISDGELSITDLGVFFFVDSWKIAKGAFSFILEFMFGGWIKTIAETYLKLPSQVGVFLQGLWVLSIILILIGLIFKRRV